ncbi:hypothetical protein R3P38DRAFT_2774458 [Favolaschia claudopus]|uniref:Uncharacterized protein n=1 Tax=Favolaschia claudopus TaxID=2862362 RepID=A0AAW0BY25_9AGAR
MIFGHLGSSQTRSKNCKTSESARTSQTLSLNQNGDTVTSRIILFGTQRRDTNYESLGEVKCVAVLSQSLTDIAFIRNGRNIVCVAATRTAERGLQIQSNNPAPIVVYNRQMSVWQGPVKKHYRGRPNSSGECGLRSLDGLAHTRRLHRPTYWCRRDRFGGVSPHWKWAYGTACVTAQGGERSGKLSDVAYAIPLAVRLVMGERAITSSGFEVSLSSTIILRETDVRIHTAQTLRTATLSSESGGKNWLAVWRRQTVEIRRRALQRSSRFVQNDICRRKGDSQQHADPVQGGNRKSLEKHCKRARSDVHALACRIGNIRDAIPVAAVFYAVFLPGSPLLATATESSKLEKGADHLEQFSGLGGDEKQSLHCHGGKQDALLMVGRVRQKKLEFGAVSAKHVLSCAREVRCLLPEKSDMAKDRRVSVPCTSRKSSELEMKFVFDLRKALENNIVSTRALPRPANTQSDASTFLRKIDRWSTPTWTLGRSTSSTCLNLIANDFQSSSMRWPGESVLLAEAVINSGDVDFRLAASFKVEEKALGLVLVEQFGKHGPFPLRTASLVLRRVPCKALRTGLLLFVTDLVLLVLGVGRDDGRDFRLSINVLGVESDSMSSLEDVIASTDEAGSSSEEANCVAEGSGWRGTLLDDVSVHVNHSRVGERRVNAFLTEVERRLNQDPFPDRDRDRFGPGRTRNCLSFPNAAVYVTWSVASVVCVYFQKRPFRGAGDCQLGSTSGQKKHVLEDNVHRKLLAYDRLYLPGEQGLGTALREEDARIDQAVYCKDSWLVHDVAIGRVRAVEVYTVCKRARAVT